MINCVIIDDEQFSVDALLRYVAMMPRLAVSAVYLNAREAMERISAGSAVDLIFLDVDMPDISGMELASMIRHQTSKLIFTTAHSKYAFGAFEADADAFLLKPFSFARFAQTVNRLFPLTDAPAAPADAPDYFLVKNKAEDLRIVNVKYDQVVAFESMQNYVKIHLVSGRAIIAYLTLQDVLALIAHRTEFEQFHRAFVISASQINYIEGQKIYMNGQLMITVGETFREAFHLFVSGRLLRTARARRPGAPGSSSS